MRKALFSLVIHVDKKVRFKRYQEDVYLSEENHVIERALRLSQHRSFTEKEILSQGNRACLCPNNYSSITTFPRLALNKQTIIMRRCLIAQPQYPDY